MYLIKKLQILSITTFSFFILTGCSSSNNISKPNLHIETIKEEYNKELIENSSKINLFHQNLFIPKEINKDELYIKKLFQAQYQKKEYSFSTNRIENIQIIETDDYETLNFDEHIYINNMKMIYKTCIDESSISRNVSNGIGMVIFSPFIVLDTLMHQKIDIATISNPYSKIKLIDFSKNESLEVLNDNIKGCDFNFKYKGLTNNLQIYFQEIIKTTNKEPKELLKNKSVENYYEIEYIENKNIQRILDFNLKNRNNQETNEKLIQEILKLNDKKLFLFLQNNKNNYILNNNSLLNLDYKKAKELKYYNNLSNVFENLKNENKDEKIEHASNYKHEYNQEGNKILREYKNSNPVKTLYSIEFLEQQKKSKEQEFNSKNSLSNNNENENVTVVKKAYNKTKKEYDKQKYFLSEDDNVNSNNIKKKEHNINIDKEDVHFFNSLKEGGNETINME